MFAAMYRYGLAAGSPMRFSTWRDPDMYNDYLIGLLKHAEPQALQAVEAYELRRAIDEKIVIDAPTGRYEISRYCPRQVRS